MGLVGKAGEHCSPLLRVGDAVRRGCPNPTKPACINGRSCHSELAKKLVDALKFLNYEPTICIHAKTFRRFSKLRRSLKIISFLKNSSAFLRMLRKRFFASLRMTCYENARMRFCVGVTLVSDLSRVNASTSMVANTVNTVHTYRDGMFTVWPLPF